jgi:diguanylate cyclase (GGDEF)-like protein
MEGTPAISGVNGEGEIGSMNDLQMLNNIQMTVLVTDRTGTIVEAHGGAGRPLGYKAAGLVGRNALELIDPGDRAIMADMYLKNSDFAIMSHVESFALRIVGPEGDTNTWDCYPGGYAAGDSGGRVTVLSCRADQSTSTAAMHCLMEGGSSRDVASVVAAHTTVAHGEWRRQSFALDRISLDNIPDEDKWELLPHTCEVEDGLMIALDQCKENPNAPWNVLEPGAVQTVELAQLPIELQDAARLVELPHCVIFNVGLDNQNYLSFVRFANSPQRVQGNQLLADRATERVLWHSLAIEHSHDRLKRAARIDPLTGISNRLRFDEIVRSIMNTSEMAVLYIDVDDFKSVNDAFGHEVGDRVLCEIASRISRLCRPQDVVARVGGDEFVLILTGASRSIAYSVAQRLEQAMLKPMAVPGPGVVSITVGVSAGADFDSLAEMVHAADQSMLASKGGWIY